MGVTAGIDIGTSNSSVAINNGRKASVLKVSDNVISSYGGEKCLSSALFLNNEDELVIGQAAYNMRGQNPSRFRSEFKREFGSEIPVLLGEKQYMIDDFYICFLQKMKAIAESIDSVDKLCLTYPADYNEDKIRRLERNANKVGFFDVVMVDEPSAAAAGYAVTTKVAVGDNILVYDFGGGTFDISLIQKNEIGYRHLTKPRGILNCGGADFDRLILNDMIQAIRSAHPDKDSNEFAQPKFVTLLAESAVKVKHQLSASSVYTESIPIGWLEYYDYVITRQQFEGLISPLVDDTCKLVQKILEDAEISAGDIKHVIMVGGTCRIPYIRKRLEKIFAADRIRLVGEPELAVCVGATECGKDDSVNKECYRVIKNYCQSAVETFETLAKNKRAQADGTINAINKCKNKMISSFIKGLSEVTRYEHEFILEKLKRTGNDISKSMYSNELLVLQQSFNNMFDAMLMQYDESGRIEMLEACEQLELPDDNIKRIMDNAKSEMRRCISDIRFRWQSKNIVDVPDLTKCEVIDLVLDQVDNSVNICKTNIINSYERALSILSDGIKMEAEQLAEIVNDRV